MTRPRVNGIAPFFIAGDLDRSLAFYRDRLGFEVSYVAPDDDPFFAIVERDGRMIFLKVVDVEPLPDNLRDPDAGLDAFVSVPDPDALAAEFSGRSVDFLTPQRDTHDGLRGFSVADPDGYVLFLGRARADGGT